jgi:hypothetical protein
MYAAGKFADKWNIGIYRRIEGGRWNIVQSGSESVGSH